MTATRSSARWATALVTARPASHAATRTFIIHHSSHLQRNYHFSSSVSPSRALSTSSAPASTLSSDAASAASPTDDRWSHILDPHNPPKLTLAHYALLNSLPAKSTAASSPQPASTPNPALDRAIGSLQRMIATLGETDPQVRADLVAMQQQLTTQPNTASSPDGALPDSDSAPSFFVPTTKLKCRFCAVKRQRAQHPTYEIAYTNLALLHQFINLRGMLYARKLTGSCGRHQRQLTQAVKRARVMGLLAFTSNWRLPEGWADVEAAGGGGGWTAGSALGSGEAVGEVGEAGTESEELSFLDELKGTEAGGEAGERGGETRDRH